VMALLGNGAEVRTLFDENNHLKFNRRTTPLLYSMF
jgi:hypothetical protein